MASCTHPNASAITPNGWDGTAVKFTYEDTPTRNIRLLGAYDPPGPMWCPDCGALGMKVTWGGCHPDYELGEWAKPYIPRLWMKPKDPRFKKRWLTKRDLGLR